MTQVVRLSLGNDKLALNTAIENECNVRAAAGFKLASSFVVGTDLVLIFQQ